MLISRWCLSLIFYGSGVALQYDTLFWGGEKSSTKSDPLVQRNKYQMDSTVMRYDQQHIGGEREPKKKMLGRGGFTHLRERDDIRVVEESTF